MADIERTVTTVTTSTTGDDRGRTTVTEQVVVKTGWGHLTVGTLRDLVKAADQAGAPDNAFVEVRHTDGKPRQLIALYDNRDQAADTGDDE